MTPMVAFGGRGVRRRDGAVAEQPGSVTSYNGVASLPVGVVTASSSIGFSRLTGAMWTTWLPWEPVATRLARYTAGTIAATDEASFLSALSSAAPWSIITLPPQSTATITGSFQLPANKPLAIVSANWATIDAVRPRNFRARFTAGERVNYARILTNGAGPDGCLTDSRGSTYSRLTDVYLYGIEFGPASGNTNELGGLLSFNNVGDFYAGPPPTTPPLSAIHNNVIIDHCLGQAESVAGNKVKNGVVFSQGARVAIIDSEFSGLDAAAPLTPVVGASFIAGPGPIFLRNCRLEGVYSSLFFGGGALWIDAYTPADIVIQGVDISKRAAWSGRANQINGMESKAARRMLAEGVRSRHNRVGQQWWSGNFTSINQNDTLSEAFTQAEDYTLRGWDVDQTSAAFYFSGVGSGVNANPLRRLYAEHLSAKTETYQGGMLFGSSASKRLRDVDLNHITLARDPADAGGPMVELPNASDFLDGTNVIRNSIIDGAMRSGTSNNAATAASDARITLRNNVMSEQSGAAAATNLHVANQAAIQFVDVAAGNLALQAGSPAKLFADDGTDAGAHPAVVAALTAGCVTGEWPSGFGY